MKIFLPLLTIIVCALSTFGQITAITEDGRKVVLNPDSTWSFAKVTPPPASTGNIFNPDEVEAVVECSKTTDFLKSAFETNKQYLLRIEKVFNEYQCGPKLLKETSFMIDASPSYNAENQEFTVTLLRATLSNAHGRSITFAKFENGDFPIESYLAKFQIPAEKARLLKANLGIGIIGFPLVKSSGLSDKIIPSKVVFFNKTTAEIYSEFKLTDPSDLKVSKLTPNGTAVGVIDDVGPGTINGGVVNGKATNLVKPAYPMEAKKSHVSGAVAVRVLIDEEGNVVSATAVSGHPLLRSAAEQAALASKFNRTTLSGQLVKVSGIITYNFVP